MLGNQEDLVQRLMMTEKRMIQWIGSDTRFDKIRNNVIRDKVEVTPREDKMREHKLR